MLSRDQSDWTPSDKDDQPLQREHFGRLLAQELQLSPRGLTPAREHQQAPDHASQDGGDNNDHEDGEGGGDNNDHEDGEGGGDNNDHDDEDGGDAHLGGSIQLHSPLWLGRLNARLESETFFHCCW